jgi:glyoxylase-like metal-dependent hydrolase (beta-lactamase superfamily II)
MFSDFLNLTPPGTDALNCLAVIHLTLLDLLWTGHPRSIASALLRSGSTNTLIDPGPSICIPTLRKQLASAGLTISDLHSIFLTHIHLDHAGATGSLLKENPNLQVFVHERGAPHMADPQNLLKSAHRLYADRMDALFGEFLPVPAANLHVLQGGETLPLGDDALHVIYTPGHASHHVTYFDPDSKIAFVGDTTGICIQGQSFILPATPPPDINLELWEESLQAIANLNPRQLFLTHFGFSDNVTGHLSAYRSCLRQWSASVANLLASGKPEEAAMQEFCHLVTEEAAAQLSPAEAEHYLYNGYLPLSWLGLARYHRKKVAAA